MLKAINKRIEALLQRSGDAPRDQKAELRDAVSALLFALLLSDDRIDDKEIAVVKTVLVNKFNYSEQQIDQYLTDLTDRAAHQVSYHAELMVIRNQCDLQERVEILDLCWQIVYADGELSPTEEHLIRRITNLLYIPHQEYIKTKLKYLPDADH